MFVIFPPAIDFLRLCLDSVNLLANAILLSISLSPLPHTHTYSQPGQRWNRSQKKEKKRICYQIPGYWLLDRFRFQGFVNLLCLNSFSMNRLDVCKKLTDLIFVHCTHAVGDLTRQCHPQQMLFSQTFSMKRTKTKPTKAQGSVPMNFSFIVYFLYLLFVFHLYFFCWSRLNGPFARFVRQVRIL